MNQPSPGADRVMTGACPSRSKPARPGQSPVLVAVATVAGDGGCGSRPQGAASTIAMLRRVTTWDEWEAGRAARRALAIQITGGNILRRISGNPRKDAMLRRLNRGERGLPFL